MKFMTACLDSSKGELWFRDQSKPLLVCSIMFFKITWVSSMVSATATKAQSSMNPVGSSLLPLAISIRSAL